ncbi:hypothetical protein CMI37_30000 [Candidatus Pacearchaeota archaeon]|jgi:hypothetical protein|nr:hypothetical protein [Candidatus Pacearchaeota archaeon]|tara:strand:- start:1468 stop:2256 length:789 start_codon:yes stop_codon:yes gene_type:complete
MSTNRALSPYKVEVLSADGSQTGSAITATITNAGAVDVNIGGTLTVTGDVTYVDTTNLKIADALIELNKDNSGGADNDAGILINRGSAGNNAALYWNEGDDKFKAVLTVSTAESDAVTDTTLAPLQASQFETSGLTIVDNEIISNDSNANIYITPSGTGTVIIANATYSGSTTFGSITHSGNEIFTNESNADLKISGNSAGVVFIDDILKLSVQSDPSAVSSTTQVYAKTQAGGGSGVFYVNSSSSGELVSKKKAQLFGIIF